MLFFHPMWSHESERLGKQKCTPTGYVLHGVAELIGFIGLLSLFAVLLILVWLAITGGFHARSLWLLAVPFGVGLISEALFQFSWWLARRRGFQFDNESREACWMEAGERRTYRYPP